AAEPGEHVELWTLGAGAFPPAGSAARLVENGTYALTRGALRYRRGGGGGQPLTGEALHGGAGGSQALDPAGHPTADPARPAAVVVRATAEVPGSERRYSARRFLALLNGAGHRGRP